VDFGTLFLLQIYLSRILLELLAQIFSLTEPSLYHLPFRSSSLQACPLPSARSKPVDCQLKLLLLMEEHSTNLVFTFLFALFSGRIQ
jgi:hypothetical protein